MWKCLCLRTIKHGVREYAASKIQNREMILRVFRFYIVSLKCDFLSPEILIVPIKEKFGFFSGIILSARIYIVYFMSDKIYFQKIE